MKEPSKDNEDDLVMDLTGEGAVAEFAALLERTAPPAERSAALERAGAMEHITQQGNQQITATGEIIHAVNRVVGELAAPGEN
jgi:hypothetical protein